jgi:hypothetical protein
VKIITEPAKTGQPHEDLENMRKTKKQSLMMTLMQICQNTRRYPEDPPENQNQLATVRGKDKRSN